MSSMKPIHLYSHATGPNPWKVAIILEELGVPYETEFLDFGVLKQEPFVNYNPNGRVPAITDPNNKDITLFESGAIIDYLIDTYDKENKLSYAESPQKYLEKSWEHFQMSGQGPYYGQFAWFSLFHSEKNITSAIDRYANEIKRVLGVIDAHLSKTGNEYLVGNKISYADLMFIPWNAFAPGMVKDFDWKTQYPKCYEWNQKMMERPAVKSVMAAKAKASGK
ncbi:uncharacterized protein LTR77_008649 [Saxophila tyrrhenica]|uniref:glutathione transferase n=1 Tax=Saxophila tyrrhenica TaxID=1690608 RepID=A0AAV9P0B7_9PEZI|nr:hypothetical protein LTR77_008649 [Saxophila tyrrhenica]